MARRDATRCAATARRTHRPGPRPKHGPKPRPNLKGQAEPSRRAACRAMRARVRLHRAPCAPRAHPHQSFSTRCPAPPRPCQAFAHKVRNCSRRDAGGARGGRVGRGRAGRPRDRAGQQTRCWLPALPVWSGRTMILRLGFLVSPSPSRPFSRHPSLPPPPPLQLRRLKGVGRSNAFLGWAGLGEATSQARYTPRGPRGPPGPPGPRPPTGGMGFKAAF